MRTVQLTRLAALVLSILFRLRVEVSDKPEGRLLGRINLPGPTVLYLNLELRVLGALALLGHFELY